MNITNVFPELNMNDYMFKKTRMNILEEWMTSQLLLSLFPLLYSPLHPVMGCMCDLQRECSAGLFPFIMWSVNLRHFLATLELCPPPVGPPGLCLLL